MPYNIKYAGLTFGLLTVISSNLFFGRQMEIYLLLFVSGLLVSLIFYLVILFNKKPFRSKLIWTLVILISVAIQWMIGPLLVKGSYLIFLKSNKAELSAINHILVKKPGDFTIINNQINDSTKFTQSERESIHILQHKINVRIILKTDDDVYYGLWGFLDNRIGVSYWIKRDKPDSSYHYLTGDWYLIQTNNQ
jgi:hypothetical protein